MAKKRGKGPEKSFVDADGGLHLGQDFVDLYNEEVERQKKELPEVMRLIRQMETMFGPEAGEDEPDETPDR